LLHILTYYLVIRVLRVHRLRRPERKGPPLPQRGVPGQQDDLHQRRGSGPDGTARGRRRHAAGVRPLLDGADERTL